MSFHTAHYSFSLEILFPWFHQYYIFLWPRPSYRMFPFCFPRWIFVLLYSYARAFPRFLSFALGSSSHNAPLGFSDNPYFLIDSRRCIPVNLKFIICTFDFSALLCYHISNCSADRCTGYPTMPLNPPWRSLVFPLPSSPFLSVVCFVCLWVGWLVGWLVVGWFLSPRLKVYSHLYSLPFIFYSLSPSPFLSSSKCHLLDSIFHPHLRPGLYHSSQKSPPQLLNLLPWLWTLFVSIYCNRLNKLSFLKHYFSGSEWLSDIFSAITAINKRASNET